VLELLGNQLELLARSLREVLSTHMNATGRLNNEILHGKKLADEGAADIWNWSGPVGNARAERRTKYLTEIGRIHATDNVLEIGCGTGIFTRKLYDATKARITGIDISEDLLEIARESTSAKDLSFVRDNAMSMSFPDETFDVVVGSSVLHHLDFETSLKEIFRVLKKGGRMMFGEPNMLNPQIFIQKNVPFIKKWAGDSPDETAIVRWSLAKQMRSTGFTSIKIFPYDFLHPATPAFLIPFVDAVGRTLEQIPILREIAGSVIIYGEKQ